MKVVMKVNGQKLEYDTHEQLTFDVEYVFDELGTQPGQLAWWHSLLSYKDEEANNFKANMESKIAQKELALRGDQTTLVALYGKVTEGVISAVLAGDPEILELKQQHNELLRDASLLKAMTRGFETRSVLLATASSAQKAEIQARLRSMMKKTDQEGSN